jgi:hypothetical protein
MYSANSAIGVRFGISKRWEVITLADWTVAQLYTTFRKVQVTLSTVSDNVIRYLDLNLIKSAHATFPGTFFALLIANGNTALPTTTIGIAFNKRVAKYKDVFKAGYTVTPVTPANLDNLAIDPALKTDIRLTRTNPATDYMLFHHTCLVSVNGFYHLNDTDGVNGVMVKDAMKSSKFSKQNQLGMYNFNQMCTLTQVPITPAMVTQVFAQSVPGQVRVNLGIDLTNKSILVCLGGYLSFVDGYGISRVGDSEFKIDFNNLPFLERFFESRKYIDLSSLSLDTTPNNLSQISLANLISDPVILAYLQLSQTFFIVLDCPEIYTQTQFIKNIGLPNRYISYTEPLYPLVTAYGRQPEYWITQEDGQYSLTVYDNAVENKIFNTVLQSHLTSVGNANWPNYPGHISDAHFLEIGRDI